ncbi:MAG: hypothetical protein ACON34_12600 [Flavobacteriales bacterium]
MNSRRFASVLLVLAAATVLASCSGTRKKNKCQTCPTWHDEVQLNEAQPQPGS